MILALTTYFNPLNAEDRYQNYRVFREHIKKAELPLHCLEIAFNDEPFQLDDSDAEKLIKLRAKDLMFQKERALNILLDEADVKYDKILWIDADIVFLENSWPTRLRAALEKNVIVQPYQYAVSLPTNEVNFVESASLFTQGSPNEFWIRRSFAYANLRSGTQSHHQGHVGYAWAAQREFLDKHKFYDKIITGAGDLFMAMAFFGTWGWFEGSEYINTLDSELTEDFFEWGYKVAQDLNGQVGYTEDLILHLYHGSILKRNYHAFCKILTERNFSFHKDVKLGENNLWQWQDASSHIKNEVACIFEQQKG